MRNRNNPLKHLPSDAFTVVQVTRDIFRRDLADLPVQYPGVRITYLSGLVGVPYLILKEQHWDFLEICVADTF